MQLAEFNTRSPAALRGTLTDCCDAPSWVEAVIHSRPYADLQSLLAAADAAGRRLDPADVQHALAAHPRIGQQAPGGSTQAGWSRGEQSGVSRDERTAAALAAGNAAYERRFGRIFLICATGLDAPQVLAALRERLTHDDDTEQAVVADELRKIALIRLRKAVEG